MISRTHEAKRIDLWELDRPSSILRCHVDLFFETFIHRMRPILTQQEDGSYRKQDRDLTRRDVVDHLFGFVTLGILPHQDGTVKLGVVDVDYATPDVMDAQFARFDAARLPYLTFASGRKGFHMVMFFDKPTPMAKARAVLSLVAGFHEIWPRQTHLEAGQIGNCIKAPLGMHRVTRRGCMAVGQDFLRIHDHWKLIQKISRVNADEILQCEHSVVPERNLRIIPNSEDLPVSMKPCLHLILEKGVEQGQRNELGFAVATELRRLGHSEQDSLDVLMRWNQLNSPPLNPREVTSTCRSAYRRPEPYQYGCNPDGALHRLIQEVCVGRSKCSYYLQVMKTLQAKKRNPE